MILIGGHSTAGGDKHPPDKRLQFKLRAFGGDPLGSREAGTLKVLKEEQSFILEDLPFSFKPSVVFEGQIEAPSTHELVQLGKVLEGKIGAVKDGKFLLDVTLSNTTIGDRKDHFQVHTESTRTITTLRLGEVVKLRWRDGSADRQTWVELSIGKNKP
jgi:hypothetical protein